MANASPLTSTMRNIPSVDELVRSDAGRRITVEAGHSRAIRLARRTLATIRLDIAENNERDLSKELILDAAVNQMVEMHRSEERASLQFVINCTGVIIHTNLGRAVLSAHARQAISDEGATFCTLEYDLETGKRGRRASHCEDLVTELTGAEAALVVNNCAAAAFFVLSVFAEGREVVISRGELVEIGGDFRVPDVLTQSGATLREVGTTNRTKLEDYEAALDNGARVILRVHPSNYRIIGFTAAPSLSDLATLARKHDVVLYEDIGSGALIDLSSYGLKDEPVVAASIAAGVDLITFSGDKLVGGPQAGIIAGGRELVDRLRRHPLYRVLRPGKLVYSALEATLESYRRGTITDVPVIAMLALNKETIRERAASFRSRFESGYSGLLEIELVDGTSAVGGGAAPGSALDTVLLALSHPEKPAESIEISLRNSNPPVISRIENNKVLLDLRTVDPAQEPILLDILRSIG